MQTYPTDLTNLEWQLLEPNLPSFKPSPARKWDARTILNTIFYVLRERVRVAEGRDPQPSACILDSQSARTTPNGGERGYGGYKRVNGRMRFIVVDTLGLVMRV